MSTFRRVLLTSVFVLLLLVVPRGVMVTVAAAEQVINGELVVLKENPRRFRIVEHAGTFAAPAGTPLESLDGRNVQVVLGPHGTVQSITEVPVAINPVVSGFEVVRGQLQVNDSLARTFTLAGDSRVYVAPAGANVGMYAGKWVEARLDPDGHVVDIHLAPEPLPQPYGAVVPAVPAAPTCNYGGEVYADGATVCQAGVQFRCDGTAWRNMGSPCPAVPPQQRSCMFDGATVASGSSICRNGWTVQCADGRWVSTQIACR